MLRIGWSTRKPIRKARERNEERIAHWNEVEWTRIKEMARKERRTLGFVYESWLPGWMPSLAGPRSWHRPCPLCRIMRLSAMN
jgi:hypothetical protein